MGSKPVGVAARLTLGALLLVLAAAARTAGADTPPLILEHLTASDGLPQSTVNTTLQDSQGFIWLGTEDGLVRYDGDQLVRYSYARGARGALPGNYIHQIVEDAHHDLWVAVDDAGLARWNRATDDFTVFSHVAHDAHSLASDAVHALLVDASGRIWIGMTDAGIDILDPATGRFQHVRHEPTHPNSLIDDRVFTLTQDRAGRIWIGTEAGLDRWDGQRQSFVHYQHIPADPHSLAGNDISSVIQAQDGELWVGSHDGGLTRLDSSDRVVESYRHDAHRPGSLSSDNIRTLLEDRYGHLWVGTADGLDLLNRSSGDFDHYRHDASDAESLRDSSIMSLYEDDSGLIWIGTYTGGVSRWNPRSWQLGGYRPAWLAGNLVTSFADAPRGQVWVGSEGGGLVRFDPASGAATELDALLRTGHALADRRVMSLRTDTRGTLWIGTMTAGLQRLSADGQLRSIPVRRGDPYATSAAGIMTIFEARDGRLWIGTYEGGLDELDPTTGRIQQLPDDSTVPGAISAASVRAIAQDQQGRLWIGTNGGGLDLADSDGHVLRVFRHDPNDPASLPSNTVYALAVDARDRVWVATDGGGLARVVGSGDAGDPIRFSPLSAQDGLSSDTIDGVLSDAAGRLWLSGNGGLIRVDPDSGVIKTFHRADGLQGEEFNTGAFFRTRDGRLCFGGAGGFNVFDPSRLTDPQQAPRLALTQVEVLGVPQASPTPTWLRQRIALNYRASVVSLDFGVLDFISPKRNRIAYRMPGLTDRWIDLGTQHRISLTNLEAGDHVLEVRAANADSVWSAPLQLTLHRDAAPWKSSWAYSAYALVLLSLLIYGASRYRARFRRMVRERAHLEREVQLRTHELVDSNRQLAEAVQVKSRFLDRMSHELRTPMNGVVGMTELLSRTPLSPAQARLAQTLRASAQILLQTVNDLLDLSRVRAGKVQLEEVPLDLVQLLEECADLLVARTQQVQVIICPPRQPWPNLLGDPLRIRQILINLTSNAVKFTERGEVVVKAEIAARPDGGVEAIFAVSDTGIGMDEATVARIFQPFTQADESTTRRFGGSGLGLAICRELIELMGGSIRVDSRPQLGSTFHVVLPLKLSAAVAQTPPSAWQGVRAAVLARRTSLGEALSNQLMARGLTVSGVYQEPGSIPADTQLVMADADLVREQTMHWTLRQPSALARAALLLVTDAQDAAAAALAEQVGARALLQRPIHREELQAALASALGVAADTDASPVVPASSRGAIVPQALSGRVLLVEDDPVNAAVAQGYLAALGCSSVWVTDGAQAVARTATEHFDMILMDLSMPGMDGFETTALIRRRDERRIPIAALTAHTSPHYRDTCLAAGMDDILSKPCTLEECARVLQRWLRHAPVVTAPPPQAAMAPSGAPAVDAETVARLQRLGGAGAPGLYGRIVELFCAGSTDTMQRLREAFERDDVPLAVALCHKLAGSAANVGALAFASEVRGLEQLCRRAELTAARVLYQRLATLHPALLEELRQMPLQESA